MDEENRELIRGLIKVNQSLIEQLKLMEGHLTEAMRLAVAANFKTDAVIDYLHKHGTYPTDADPSPSNRVEGL